MPNVRFPKGYKIVDHGNGEWAYAFTPDDEYTMQLDTLINTMNELKAALEANTAAILGNPPV